MRVQSTSGLFAGPADQALWREPELPDDCGLLAADCADCGLLVTDCADCGLLVGDCADCGLLVDDCSLLLADCGRPADGTSLLDGLAPECGTSVLDGLVDPGQALAGELRDLLFPARGGLWGGRRSGPSVIRT